jgi:hypothetical protein
MKVEGQEPPAHLAQAESKKMQIMRTEGRLGRRALDRILPGYCSMS